MDEVLQTHSIFCNISKGQLANKNDLYDAFGSKDEILICKILLEKGDLQVSERERKKQIEYLYKEIVRLVVNKTINIETQRPYPTTVLTKFVDSLHFPINTNKNAKQQALELLKVLKHHIPIQIVKMKIRIQLPVCDSENFEFFFKLLNCSIESKKLNNCIKEYICFIDPGEFRQLSSVVISFTGKKDSLKVLNLSNTNDEEELISIV